MKAEPSRLIPRKLVANLKDLIVFHIFSLKLPNLIFSALNA